MIEPLVYQRGQMNPMGPMGQMGQGSTINTLLWVIIGLLLIIIVYLWYNNRNNEPQTSEEVSEAVDVKKIEVALRLLNSGEKQVVEALIERGGEMLQKDIHYELDMSRVQAHRIVQGLIQRDLVTVTDHYNTKKVIIAEWLMN
jgi:uncharacterized membrane protein